MGKTAAIIGGGVIGGGWAARFALNGWQVQVFAPDPQAEAALRAHPKCRVILCDDDYWNRRSRKGRPDKHQPRQSLNATHCLNKRPQVDWLAHIDVDEFLWSEIPIADRLARVAPDRESHG